MEINEFFKKDSRGEMDGGPLEFEMNTFSEKGY